MKKITLDIEKMAKIVENADKIMFDDKAEQELLKLLEMQEKVELAITTAKNLIELTALKLDPNFSSIQGSLVKVSYRSYGSKYVVDPSLVDQIEPELINTKVTHSVNTKALEPYLRERNKGLPLGINAVDRPKKISISAKRSK